MNVCLCVTDKGKDGRKVIEMEGYLEIQRGIQCVISNKI